MILVDTSIWVEMALGTVKGRKAKDIIKAATATYCCVLSISELVAWAERNNVNSIDLLNDVSQTASYLDLNYDTLRQAGVSYVEVRKTKNKIGMIDMIIYVTAQVHGLKLLTCDMDFEGLPDVELIR